MKPGFISTLGVASCMLLLDGCGHPAPPVRTSPAPVAVVDDLAAQPPRAFDGASGTWLSASARSSDGSDVLELGSAGLVERSPGAGDARGATTLRSFGAVSWLGPSPVRVDAVWRAFEPADCRTDAYSWVASSALGSGDVWAIVDDPDGGSLCHFDGSAFAPLPDRPPTGVQSLVATSSGLYALTSAPSDPPRLLHRPLDGAEWTAVTLPPELMSSLDVAPFASGLMLTGYGASGLLFVRVDASGAEIVARFELPPTPDEATGSFPTPAVGVTLSDLWVRIELRHFDGASGCGYDINLRYSCASPGSLRWTQNVVYRHDGTSFVEVAHLDHTVDGAVPVAGSLLLFADAQAFLAR